MKVLVCVPELEKGGGIANYYGALKDHFTVEVRYFTRGSRNGSRGTIRQVKRILADYGGFAKTLSKDRQILAVHINTSFGSRGIFRDSVFVLLAKLQRRKVLVFFRGWNENFERQVDRPSVRLALRSFFLADHILVLSEQFRETLQRWGYRGEIGTESTVVAQHLIEAASARAIRREESLPEVGLTTLFLARLERDKGVYVAVDAHAALLPRYPSLRLLIAGDGAERDRLPRYVEERGIANVEFLGHVRGEAKTAAFQRADLYIFPTSHGEGMPNSVLEAMAFGIPIVTRGVGGLRDFFRDGEMGFVTEATDSNAFAQLLARLIDDADLRARISRTNHQHAAEHFAAIKVVHRLEGIYRDLLTR